MSLILCDTDVMIDFLYSNKARHVKTDILVRVEIGIDNILISSMTEYELIIGCSNKRDFNDLTKKINGFTRIEIDQQIDKTVKSLLLKYYLSHNLQIQDAFVAATALYYELELFTYNLKDFRFINGLKLYKPKS